MIIDPPVLVILSPGFAANEADTTCLTSQQNLVKSLNKIYPLLKIIVLCSQYPFVSSMYYWHGNKVISFNGQNKGKLNRLWVWRKIWTALKKINRENKVIGLLSFWCGECALLGKHFASKYNLPHYCWILGQDAKAQNKYVRYINPSPEQLIALSDFLQDEFYRNHGIKPKHVIPNGVEPGQFPKSTFNKLIDLLGVGSLIPLKQFDIFIELIHELKQDYPNINAAICGNGPERRHLQSLIKKFSLKKNITLLGELPHREVLRLMLQSKILLHPSCYEGFSTVCLEALYAGNKVISFCRPMKAPIVNWFIVGNREEMKEKLANLLNINLGVPQRVIPYTMDETAKAIGGLFLQKLSAIN